MSSPSFNLEDYNLSVSIALFSQPSDFFKPYASLLKQVGGKFNYNLRGRPGWIFSKKREGEVRTMLEQIKSTSEHPITLDGYQEVVIIVIRPEVGKTLMLEVDGSKSLMKVESIHQNGKIVDMANVTLPDGQQKQIKLENGVWKLSDFPKSHVISLP